MSLGTWHSASIFQHNSACVIWYVSCSLQDASWLECIPECILECVEILSYELSLVPGCIFGRAGVLQSLSAELGILLGCRIEDAESELRRLLADHKRMYAAQDQQQEQEQHQQQAAVQRVEEARQQHRRYNKPASDLLDQTQPFQLHGIIAMLTQTLGFRVLHQSASCCLDTQLSQHILLKYFLHAHICIHT